MHVGVMRFFLLHKYTMHLFSKKKKANSKPFWGKNQYGNFVFLENTLVFILNLRK
jgi:hypothetical protein